MGGHSGFVDDDHARRQAVAQFRQRRAGDGVAGREPGEPCVDGEDFRRRARPGRRSADRASKRGDEQFLPLGVEHRPQSRGRRDASTPAAIAASVWTPTSLAPGRVGQRLGGDDADAQPGERPGAGRRADQVDVGAGARTCSRSSASIARQQRARGPLAGGQSSLGEHDRRRPPSAPSRATEPTRPLVSRAKMRTRETLEGCRRWRCRCANAVRSTDWSLSDQSAASEPTATSDYDRCRDAATTACGAAAAHP